MTVRWTITDGFDTYTFPVNPKDMASHGVAVQRDSLPAAVNNTSVRVSETSPKAYEWTFSGRIYSQQQYDDLLNWVYAGVPVELTDHLNRTFRVVLTAFNPTDLRRPGTTIRWDYEMRAIVLGEI